MTRALKTRLAKLEQRLLPDPSAPREVWLCFKDDAGVWRSNSTGEPVPSEEERKARGLFAIKIVAMEPDEYRRICADLEERI